MAVSLSINGDAYTYHGDPLTPLVDVLRNEALLTGTKAVCGEGFCGACMVHLDGKPTVSCLCPVGLVAGLNVTTIESIAAGDVLNPIQQALEDLDAVQCGMCFPGIVMTLTAFLDQNPNADRAALKAALSGNICRCTGYERIIDAALVAMMNTERPE
ncbi:(2Fe-2S)-binding protein (plasmid) [Rhizobium sp. TH2]|uniref:(2Fe-2S)-binding protein n=1 Tax=Rhizobium sp. TH2 TaxID=2775403 RepID=UPI002157BACF|nr:(2Fe-2S)-binding protein [Rhizobium sp. TH2]UVC12157.1 (2Fe-2S)-binding protein [Rhizobium sp. TH2]